MMDLVHMLGTPTRRNSNVQCVVYNRIPTKKIRVILHLATPKQAVASFGMPPPCARHILSKGLGFRYLLRDYLRTTSDSENNTNKLVSSCVKLTVVGGRKLPWVTRNTYATVGKPSVRFCFTNAPSRQVSKQKMLCSIEFN